MIVYCNCGLSPEFGIRNQYVVDYLDGLIYHFQDLNFGQGVEEVAYYMACGDEEYLRYIGKGISYSRKSRSLGSIFFLDYNIARGLEIEKLLLYVSRQMIEESARFGEKKVKDFDLGKYIESLEDYFEEAMQLMRDGKKPGEGKVLNSDIQLAMAKKWSKL